MKYPFLGEFTVATGQTYTVTEDCYNEPSLVELTDERDIINAVQHIAIQRAAYELREGSDLNRNSYQIDPVPRFVGDILLFDANNLAHRVRHTYNLSYRGIDVSVTYGFLNVLAATVRKYEAKAILVLWDDRVPIYRRQTLPEYKANRDHSQDEDYDDFLRQIRELDEILALLGVFSTRLHCCEADDAIYHASRMLHGDYRKVVVSSDMDLAQCINYSTVVYNPNKDTLIDRTNFKDIVGVEPEAYLVYKCLIGDSSDNLPGCKGIGPTGAVKLLEQFGPSPSGMLNSANRIDDGSRPLSDSVATKLQAFGLSGFKSHMDVIRLDYDRCGARLKLFRKLPDWQPFNLDEVKKWLLSRAFVSLAEPEFYKLFRPLKSPGSLLEPEIGTKLQMPAVSGLKSPLNALEAQYG